MKAREFWIDLNIMEVLTPDMKREDNDVFVREVIPINWDKVWAGYCELVTEDKLAFLLEENINLIQELVEKQLAGEE